MADRRWKPEDAVQIRRVERLANRSALDFDRDVIVLAPARVSRWLACPRKDCCSFSYICVSGDDVARIARTMALEPWTFTVAIAAPDDADDGFLLAAAGPRFRLALARVLFEEGGRAQCAFLASLSDGSARCGLGELRPAACATFPAREDGEAIVLDAAGCSCDWGGVPLEDPELVRQLAAMAEARKHYAGVVARWNAYVRACGFEEPLEVRDFGRFLLDAYGQ
jgi:hypothetical protein